MPIEQPHEPIMDKLKFMRFIAETREPKFIKVGEVMVEKTFNDSSGEYADATIRSESES